MTQIIKIPGRIESSATGNIVTGANSILDDTKGKKQNVINNEVDAELVRLDQEKQNNLTFDNAPTEDSNNPVKSGGVYAADKALSDAIDAILLLIPSAASSLNQLADKNFVNSSISTATATPRGTYNLVSDLDLTTDATRDAIAEKLGDVIDVADLNDYAFVQVPVSDDDPAEIERTERYKFNGNVWIYEYTLNTSGFTAAQWDAINSGITTALVAKLNGLPTAEALELALGAITQNIQNISAVIPTEATAQNQLTDKAYVLAQILAATPSFKGQFTTLAQLQDVTGVKAGDLGIVRTKDSDGHDVFTFYQHLNDQWNEYFVLSYHPQDKTATTGWLGDYPYNGMGRVELPMNMVDGWPDNIWIYLPKNDVVYLLYSWRLQLYAVYNLDTQEGLGLDDNLVIKPANYDIADLEEIVDGHYLTFTEDNGVWTITKPDDSTITSTELNNTNIYHFNDPTHHGINVLTQEMLNRTDTIYVIQYDYDLDGATITIPANCMLDFVGGSINNGTIVGNNTSIEANLVSIFGEDVIFSGSWNLNKVHISWFLGSSQNHDSVIAKGMSLGCPLDFDRRTMTITQPVVQSVPLMNGTLSVSESLQEPIDYVLNCSSWGSRISDITILAHEKAKTGIYANGGQEYNYMDYIHIRNCIEYGIKVQEAWMGEWHKLMVYYCGVGMQVANANGVKVEKAEFLHCDKALVIESGAASVFDGLDTSFSNDRDIDFIYSPNGTQINNWYTERFAGGTEKSIIHMKNIGTIGINNAIILANGGNILQIDCIYENAAISNIVFENVSFHTYSVENSKLIKFTGDYAAYTTIQNFVFWGRSMNPEILTLDWSSNKIHRANICGVLYKNGKNLDPEVFMTGGAYDSGAIYQASVFNSDRVNRRFAVYRGVNQLDYLMALDAGVSLHEVGKISVNTDENEYIIITDHNNIVYNSVPTTDFLVLNDTGQSIYLVAKKSFDLVIIESSSQHVQ